MVKINGGDGDNYFNIHSNNNVGKSGQIDKNSEIEIPIGRTNQTQGTSYATGNVDTRTSSDPILDEQVELLANTTFNNVSENYADNYNFSQSNLSSNPDDLYLPISQNDTAWQMKYGNIEYDLDESYLTALA